MTISAGAIERVRQSQPVFIWAPCGRCGTGLLQRLITSSREVLVFGEDRYLGVELPNLILVNGRIGPTTDASAKALAEGDWGRWCPDALPDAELYQQTLLESFFALARTYKRGARRLGYARWGSKLPSFTPELVATLHQLLPRAKHLFIYRHVQAVLRSYKARRWLHSLSDVQRICDEWCNGIAGAKEMEDLELLRYEALVADPAKAIHGLCATLEVERMDPAVFDHKVNTWASNVEDRGVSPTQYVEPLALDPKELATMQRRCEATLAALDYPLHEPKRP